MASHTQHIFHWLQRNTHLVSIKVLRMRELLENKYFWNIYLDIYIFGWLNSDSDCAWNESERGFDVNAVFWLALCAAASYSCSLLKRIFTNRLQWASSWFATNCAHSWSTYRKSIKHDYQVRSEEEASSCTCVNIYRAWSWLLCILLINRDLFCFFEHENLFCLFRRFWFCE